MPDIQTEMQKILQAWEQPETTQQPPKDTPMFTKTIGVSEASFNIVRDQPGLPKKEYLQLLERKGFKKASTSSILSQMVKQGHIWVDSSGFLNPNQAEYTPIKAASSFNKKAKKVKTFKVKTSEPKGITSLVATPVTTDRVQEIMNTISLPDAKRLHKTLNDYFGSV